ncbi:bifunctional cytidylyltransferase/SDR family oxidoreductase [Amnibacterium sp.]|uniref:bifunctional cytidylyltransferase/SDR family oxidoreductase n=1 Tax=Amnibacterium sp. TaxID=1872496 RepID=UPI002626DBB9|nr:bifunctional cytidylyltransferase/SDR family oxidoreductase [Amnibacterium sp.]MCU1473178.1 family NAD(P)-dependent oxidoreductase [Amnibacterium sp.]
MATTGQRMRTVAVILAGGVGVRAGLGMPKQLARIAGKPIIEHTIAAVNAADCIDEILVMMEPNHMSAVEDLIERGSYPKLTRVFAGGASRNDTTRLALEQLGDDECKVLFHDAVRPFVDERILQDCVEALDHYGAVDTAIPSADTIIQINTETNVLVDVPPRSLLRRGQTPQAFLLSAIRRAYERAARDRNFVATDDCTVVLKYTPDVPIAVIAGSDENMKITESIDVFIADKLFQLKSAEPGGLSNEERERGLDGKTVVVFGGSEGIGRAIADAAERFGATVFPFSRTATGTDIRKRKSVKAALELAAEQSGRIDFVVNSAGILEMGGLETFSHERVKNSIKVNLLGPIMIAQEALPYLKKSKGQLLFFTSSSYTRGRANYGMYSATKAATVNLTQSLSEEWAELAVRVNCINPERTKTGMRTKAFGEEPEGTLLAAETVAMASIDTLLSEVTGQIVDVRRRSGAQQARVDA